MSSRRAECVSDISEIGCETPKKSDDNIAVLLEHRKIDEYFICPVCKSPLDKINIRFCYTCGWEEYSF